MFFGVLFFFSYFIPKLHQLILPAAGGFVLIGLVQVMLPAQATRGHTDRCLLCKAIHGGDTTGTVAGSASPPGGNGMEPDGDFPLQGYSGDLGMPFCCKQPQNSHVAKSNHCKKIL